MKRIIFCFDGTWNRPESGQPTNVQLMAEAIPSQDDHGITQIVHYDTGVGTTRRDRWLGGITGYGLFAKIQQAYQFLIFNYDPGDEVYLFGFSRGAFTARSFIGFIRAIGVLKRGSAYQIQRAIDFYKAEKDRDSRELLRFRAEHSPQITVCREDEDYRLSPEHQAERRKNELPDYVAGSAFPFRIRYIGIWDTVETLGFAKVIWPYLPGTRGRRYVGPMARFHKHHLCGMVTAGRHAVALDEKRRNFDVERWSGEVWSKEGKTGRDEKSLDHYNWQAGFGFDDPERLFQERFFPGSHGSVGGGGKIRALSDLALEWVADGAEDLGLKFAISTRGFDPNYDMTPYAAPLDNNFGRKVNPFKAWFYRLTGRWRGHRPTRDWDVDDVTHQRWADPDGQLGEAPYRPQILDVVAPKLSLPKAMMMAPERKDMGFTSEFLAEYEDQHSEKIRSSLNSDMIGPVHLPGKARFYLVKKGDTLVSIAANQLDHPNRYKDIIAANFERRSALADLRAGTIIRLPI